MYLLGLSHEDPNAFPSLACRLRQLEVLPPPTSQNSLGRARRPILVSQGRQSTERMCYDPDRQFAKGDHMRSVNELLRPLLLKRSSSIKPLPRNWRFSDELDINILPDGQPAVGYVGPSQTQTMTRVRNETTDQD